MNGFKERLVITVEGVNDSEQPFPLEGDAAFNWIQPGIAIPREMVKPGSDGPDYLIQKVKREQVVERGKTILVTRASVVAQAS